MIGALESFDLWFVEERLERKGLVPPERRSRALQEFRRYMALVGLGYRGLGMLDPDVDEVWHAFLLFTREYADFCQSAFGSFIHHVPRTSRAPLPESSGENFLSAYAEVFGEAAVGFYADRPAIGAGVSDEPTGCGTEDCTDG
jgi:hypothetical protein